MKGLVIDMEAVTIILLIFIIACALSVALTKDLLTAIVIFMSQSLVMCLMWLLLQSPDLAITEAAVGAGITTLLLFVTLKKIHAIDKTKESEAAKEMKGDDVNGSQKE